MAAAKKKGGYQGKGTLIVVALLAVLGIWSWFRERSPVVEPGQSPPVSDMVGMKPDDVTHLELIHNGQTIALAKSGKAWRVEKPVQARANDAAVQQVIDSLLKGTVDQVIAEKATNLGQYGLDPPIFEASFRDAKGHEKVLQTGIKDIRGFSVYARGSDSPQLFLLSSYSIDDVTKKTTDDLRDKTVLALNPDAITQLSLQTPAQTVRVEKQGAKWQMTAPQAAPADSDTVTAVLDQIRDLKADRFEGASAKAGPDGLAPARLTVTLTGPAGAKGLLLGKATPDGKDVYAMRPGETEIFQVPKSAYDALAKNPGDLRDKTLMSFKRDDATRVTITTTSPAQTLELTHPPSLRGVPGKDWNITKPFVGKPKDDKLSTLLFTLEVVKGSRLVEEKPANLAKYGLDKPTVQVEVALPKGPQELLIGKKASPTEYYARCNTQNAVFTVPDFTVNDLKVNANDLKQTPPALAKK